MRRLLAIALMSCWAASPAVAQTADTPIMGSSASQEQTPPDDTQQLTRILVLGDAVGGGLGAGLLRMGEADGQYEVTIRFNEESGLARPEVYDWAETLPKILESSSYDVIVVLLGINDRQMIRSGNERFVFNTPAWIAAYRSQVDRLLDQLKESGSKVYWVSIPPVANPEYDAAMRIITDIQRQRVEARGVAFLDIRSQFTTPDGQYTDSGPDDTGGVRKLRGRDGISFFKQGNNRLGQLVLQAIESAKTPEPKTAKIETPVAPKVEREQPKPREAPLFGQELMLGEIYTVQPKDVTMSAMLVVGDGLPPGLAMQTIRALAPPGSAAEKLFKLGEAGPAPRGRADDFSAPPAAAN